ncbi:MAG TPA: hypothetical protein V6C81_18490 [Planktothrix sp.]
MNQTQTVDVIEQRLNTLATQLDAASEAHAAIHRIGNSPSGPEINLIVDELGRLARLAKTHCHSPCTGATCSYRAHMDALLQQTDRLLQWDKEYAARALKRFTGSYLCGGTAGSFGTVESFEIYGNLAILEAFSASVRAVAYGSLSIALQSHRAEPLPQEPQLPPEIYRG